MNYEEMSDREINGAVVEALAGGGGPDYIDGDDDTSIDLVGEVDLMAANGVHVQEIRKYGSVDYCNNPSDAWPIITENSISVFDTGKNVYGWAASDNIFKFYNHDKQIYHFNKNPLRAAMICFLKMKEAES